MSVLEVAFCCEKRSPVSDPLGKWLPDIFACMNAQLFFMTDKLVGPDIYMYMYNIPIAL